MKIKEQPAAEPGRLARDPPAGGADAGPNEAPGALIRMERQVQDAMQALIDAKLVTVRRESMWLEIEINTDILFPSGAGEFSRRRRRCSTSWPEVLKPFPNPIRVEGHTDDRPIKTAAFPSNWELSAARAASVVHEFTKAGIDPAAARNRRVRRIPPAANDTSRGATPIAGSRYWYWNRAFPPRRPPRAPTTSC